MTPLRGCASAAPRMLPSLRCPASEKEFFIDNQLVRIHLISVDRPCVLLEGLGVRVEGGRLRVFSEAAGDDATERMCVSSSSYVAVFALPCFRG